MKTKRISASDLSNCEGSAKISRLALGHETEPARKVYHVCEDYSQEDDVDGLDGFSRNATLSRKRIIRVLSR